VIGCLGTDSITRSLEGLLATTRGLDESISAFMFTGGYHLPVPTITGSVQRDLILIDRCVGVGEIAISDHR